MDMIDLEWHPYTTTDGKAPKTPPVWLWVKCEVHVCKVVIC